MIKNIVIVVLVIAVAILAGFNIQSIYTTPVVQNPDQNTPPDQAAEWKTYSNLEYGFELQYPADWKFASDTLAGEPRFSIYKEGEAPLSHHVNSTQVSIFPNGLGTEGPGGESHTVDLNLTAADERSVVEYYLSDGKARGYFLAFDDAPAVWESYGYLWAAVEVMNQQVTELPTENPDYIPMTQISGEINDQDWATVKEILATFRFVK